MIFEFSLKSYLLNSIYVGSCKNSLRTSHLSLILIDLNVLTQPIMDYYLYWIHYIVLFYFHVLKCWFILLLWEFSHQHMVFYWSLRDNKFPQVAKTLLGILTDLNSAVVWMVSTLALISKYSSPFIIPFGECTEHNDYNWYDRHFHVPQFFQLSSKVLVLISLFAFFHFYSVICRDSKIHNSAGSLFGGWTITRCGRLIEIKRSVCIPDKIVSHCPGWILGCAYTICSYGQI